MLQTENSLVEISIDMDRFSALFQTIAKGNKKKIITDKWDICT